MSLTPTQLSLRYLRDEFWTAQVVEHWVPGANVRRDLFGFIDIIAVKQGETLAVQATTNTNVSARLRKIADNPNIGHVRDAGWRIHVHGWSKKGGRWVLRTVDVS